MTCFVFYISVKNQFRLDGSTQNFLVKTTIIVKNCLDLIFEGLQRHLKSFFGAIYQLSGQIRVTSPKKAERRF